jgi:hypothetical protein
MSLPGIPRGSLGNVQAENTVNRLVREFNAERTLLTVAQLPSAAQEGVGARRFVSDATSTTFWSVVAGGGTDKVCVRSDGTDWRVG